MQQNVAAVTSMTMLLLYRLLILGNTMASCRISCVVRRRFGRGQRLISQSALSLSGADSSSNAQAMIPDPTWSIASLELTSKHQKLPAEEVQRLAHLALLNLEQMPEGLEQDLANMMHMVQQVSDCVADPANQNWFDSPLEDEFGTFQYDFVRGVTAAPLRGITDPTDIQQEHEAANVWETYLQRKTMRQGGSHKFFAISTKHQVKDHD